ncbi:MAG TPA: BamA/TamA family outer membrane protein, partial [Chitinophagaceae bacterium]
MKRNFNRACMWVLISASAYILPTTTKAQLYHPTEPSGTITIAANTQYDKAGKMKRVFFGDHYRKEWATPVEIPILDLETFAGGLTPVKVGGGLQTKSLRLKGNDGRVYVLRMVNKDVSKAIVAELRETFAQDIVQDQVSSANPYAPMVVASLAKAAGIFHSMPQMVYVPKTDRLEEFNNLFGETVCLIEERPTDKSETNEAFGFSNSVVNTEKLLGKVFISTDNTVDERAFLKARLFDMLIGDWDRHEDQWLWAVFKEEDKTIYKPIPRDRDQAFSSMDGLIPMAATRKWGVRKIQDFDYTIRDVYGLNMSGGHLDRNFTTRLTLKNWLRIAEEIQDSLTDEVIADAFREMPDAIYNISGKETVAKLKRRRADLQKYAADYYHFLSKEVNITGTSQKEVFEVVRLNNDSTLVTVYHVNEETERREEVYQRVFLRSETNEIRLYGLGGDDKFSINGYVNKGILVRVIGGKGSDIVSVTSRVKQAGHQTMIYDDQKSIFHHSKDTRSYISNDTLKNNYNRKAYVFDWLAPLGGPGYNVDDGFLLNTGFILKKQQFGKAKYGQLHMLTGSYAFSTQAWALGYTGVFREFIGKSDLHLDINYHSPSYTRNYYGLGNETVNDEDADKNYYRLRMSQFSFGSSMHRQLGKKHTISLGSEFQTVNIENSDGRFISTGGSKLDSADFERKKYANLKFAYQFNTLDNPLFPRKGIKFTAGATYTRNLDEKEKQFVEMFSEASTYFSLGRFTFASRAGVATNSNDD